jgi:hypothetical protein
MKVDNVELSKKSFSLSFELLIKFLMPEADPLAVFTLAKILLTKRNAIATITLV